MVIEEIKKKWGESITHINALEQELFKNRVEVYELAMKGSVKLAKELRNTNFFLKKEIHRIRCNLWRYEEEYLNYKN